MLNWHRVGKRNQSNGFGKVASWYLPVGCTWAQSFRRRCVGELFPAQLLKHFALMSLDVPPEFADVNHAQEFITQLPARPGSTPSQAHNQRVLYILCIYMPSRNPSIRVIWKLACSAIEPMRVIRRYSETDLTSSHLA